MIMILISCPRQNDSTIVPQGSGRRCARRLMSRPPQSAFPPGWRPPQSPRSRRQNPCPDGEVNLLFRRRREPSPCNHGNLPGRGPPPESAAGLLPAVADQNHNSRSIPNASQRQRSSSRRHLFSFPCILGEILQRSSSMTSWKLRVFQVTCGICFMPSMPKSACSSIGPQPSERRTAADMWAASRTVKSICIHESVPHVAITGTGRCQCSLW